MRDIVSFVATKSDKQNMVRLCEKKYLTDLVRYDKIFFVAAKAADKKGRKVQKKVLDERGGI